MGMYLNPGNSAFAITVESNYVDKTGLISLINKTINKKHNLTCISRPRRLRTEFNKLLKNKTDENGVESDASVLAANGGWAATTVSSVAINTGASGERDATTEEPAHAATNEQSPKRNCAEQAVSSSIILLAGKYDMLL